MPIMDDNVDGRDLANSRRLGRRALDLLFGDPARQPLSPRDVGTGQTLLPWIGTLAILGLATLVATSFHAMGLTEANLVMTYVLAVVFIGTRFGSWASAVSSVLAVLLFDILFTTPYYAVTVHDTQYFITFSVMLLVGLLASTLTARIRRQADVAASNERRTEALYRLSRTLSAVSGLKRLVELAEGTVAEVFDGHTVIYLADDDGRITPVFGRTAVSSPTASELGTAQRVFDEGQVIESEVERFPNTLVIYLPLATPDRTVGVLTFQPQQPSSLQPSGVRRLLNTYAAQIALAVERERLTEDAQRTRVQMESERLRSSLLSAVSHDLRTPLAGIAGSSSMLANSYETLNGATRRELLETICEESERLSRLVENLLNMTRLSSGTVTVTKQWQPVDDVVGSALNHIERLLGNRRVDVSIPDDLPLGHFDSVLIEQVLINLLDNAVKYSPQSSALDITATNCDDGITVEVADRGSGLRPGDERRVFEMFYRGADAKPDRRGTGLGLAICKAIVEAHGGTIEAASRQGGGTVVRFVLPHSGKPPRISLESPTMEDRQ
jgi:two-component system sensor histidine kinase KdpD